jgi:hypothetical protein
VLSNDSGGLDGGVLVNKLKPILVLSSDELVRFEGESLLVSLEVGIRSLLGSLGGIEISLSSVHDEGLGIELILGLVFGIKGALLGVDGSLVGSFLIWEFG